MAHQNPLDSLFGEEEAEEEEDQRSPVTACHRKIRLDGKADEEVKCQKANPKKTMKKPCHNRHTSHALYASAPGLMHLSSSTYSFECLYNHVAINTFMIKISKPTQA